jgi:hypothetical protein
MLLPDGVRTIEGQGERDFVVTLQEIALVYCIIWLSAIPYARLSDVRGSRAFDM